VPKVKAHPVSPTIIARFIAAPPNINNVKTPALMVLIVAFGAEVGWLMTRALAL
jgi:hypothetical protein